MRQLFGRTVIYTDEKEINRDNLISVLTKANTVHQTNSNDIQYLYDYYKGKTPILGKTKEVRENINHKVWVNRAHEIVNFKLGYCFGEPIQYIRRGEEENLTKDIATLNDYMYLADKATADKELAEWMLICGVGYRITMPTDTLSIYTLDPRNTFVIRYSGLGHPVVAAVTYVEKENLGKIYSVYTNDAYYETDLMDIQQGKALHLGGNPIIEYRANNAMLGAFEVVLPLLDAINEIESNRLDDIVQFVNSFLAVIGAELDEETVKKVNEWKMMALPDGADAKYLAASLKQSDIQTLVDDLYQTILTICGLPNRNGGSSTSDTGAAVQLRDGWEAAEANAKSIETMFKRSEKQFLKVALRILHANASLNLKVEHIEAKFARRHTDNILTKVQAMVQLLDAGISPEIAIATAGIWNDPTDVAIQSKKYLAKWEINDVSENRSDFEDTENESPKSI
jgi:SPP1 family phage portal protein